MERLVNMKASFKELGSQLQKIFDYLINFISDVGVFLSGTDLIWIILSGLVLLIYFLYTQ